jgi:hypothetical protein
MNQGLKTFQNLLMIFVVCSSALGNLFAADNLVSVTPDHDSVGCFTPVFVTILTTKNFSNGFNPDEIKLDCEITGPQGESILLPCFFKATVNSQAQWQARFAPRKVGTYSYKIALTEGGTTASSSQYALKSIASAKPGFIHTDSTTLSLYTFRFDSGKLWRGIGEDEAWEAGGPYATQFPRLAATGCNMVRVWHCNWHMPFEWNSAPNIYNTSTADYMDSVVKLAENNGIYMMVCMNDYRDFSEQWASNPYNTAKGGWCSAFADFFSNASAMQCYKKRIRYYAARWGYSPAIQSWEFFNEIDNAVNTSINVQLGAWCDTMSRCFHQLDINQHLVTASVSWQSIPNMWTPAGMDFTQNHLYGPDNRITRLPSQAQGFISSFKKPYVCGEFSRRYESATSEASINYRNELHYGMYLGLVNETPVAPMTWWWDSHWAWGDDFVFKSAAGYSNDIVTKAGSGTIMKLDVAATGGVEFGGVKTNTAANYAYAWVTNYNGSATASNVTLTISGLPTGNGQYTVESYDTWNGGFSGATTAISQNGTLAISAGSLASGNFGSAAVDKAFRITSLNPAQVAPDVVASAGQQRFGYRHSAAGITVFGAFDKMRQVEVAMFDLAGRAVAVKSSADIRDNTIDVPTKSLHGQFYVLRIKTNLKTLAFKVAL